MIGTLDSLEHLYHAYLYCWVASTCQFTCPSHSLAASLGKGHIRSRNQSTIPPQPINMIIDTAHQLYLSRSHTHAVYPKDAASEKALQPKR
jgi:hypothetical protein